MTANTPALTLSDVTVTYEDGSRTRNALEHLDLEVQPGELVAVLGPSGSGKSTLLSVAGTLLRPTSGRVLLDGKDITDASPRERAILRRRQIGFVFQSANLLDALTARENLLVMATLDGINPAQWQDRADGLLDDMGLTNAGHLRPAQLSGGERQRVGLARALIHQPRVILADEPTSALDADRGRAAIDLLANATREHQTATVWVTHDTRYLDRADRILSLEDGQLSDSKQHRPALARR